jgi:hypothetical protein
VWAARIRAGTLLSPPDFNSAGAGTHARVHAAGAIEPEMPTCLTLTTPVIKPTCLGEFAATQDDRHHDIAADAFGSHGQMLGFDTDFAGRESTMLVDQ